MGTENLNKSLIYIEKIKNLLNLKNDYELAKLMKVSQTTFSTWKKEDNFNISLFFKEFPQISPNWLLYDIGNPYLSENLNSETNDIINENEYLKNELKKIDAEIDETHADIGHIRTDINQEISEIPSDTIKTIKELRQENKLLLEMIHNLSAKLLKG